MKDRPERCVRFKEEALRQRLRTGHVDCLEIFCGSRGLTFAVSGEGLTVGEGLDMPSESYGKAWHLDRDEVWAQVRWMSAEGLRPRAIHSGLPCTKLSRIGYRDERDPDAVRYVELTIEVMEHQERQGLLGSVENPIGSLLWTMRRWKRFFGRGREPGVGELKEPWRYATTDLCMHNKSSPGLDDKVQPMRKGPVWLCNFDLSAIVLRCRGEGCTPIFPSREHRQVRGSVRTEEGWSSLACASGKYTPELCSVYAKSLKVALSQCPRKIPRTSRLRQERGKQLEVNVHGEKGDVVSPLYLLGPAAKPPQELSAEEQKPQGGPMLPGGKQEEKERDERHERLLALGAEANKKWMDLAKKKDWSQVRAPMSIYRFLENEFKEDPRLTDEYRAGVTKALTLEHIEEAKKEYPHLSEADIRAASEVLARKAGGLWLDGTPRTRVRHVEHDCVPTGPPVRTPVHNLKGE